MFSKITAVYLEYLFFSSTAVGSCSDPKQAGERRVTTFFSLSGLSQKLTAETAT